MITKEQTAAIVKEFGAQFGKNDTDAGCTGVQVAVLTTRINNLTPHFSANKHDYSANRGLLKMIGKRRRLLRYLAASDDAKYKALIGKLGLRK